MDVATKVDRYHRGLAAYREALVGLEAELPTDAHRVEHQFECLRDWSLLHELPEVEAWFEACRAADPMQVERIALKDCAQWEVDPATGDVRHSSGAFFEVHGIRVTMSHGREVGGRGWDQPILTQIGYDGGLLGIIRQRRQGVPHYLVQAKAEPGNYALVQMSPTLQATFSNLQRAHQGRKPQFASFFETPEAEGATVLHRKWLSEDGGRLFNKRNLGMMVEVPEERALELPDGFRWVSMWQIKACLLHDAWVNPHIRGIIAHL